MKLLAAILFATATIAIASKPAEEVISKMKSDLDNLGKMFQEVEAKNCNIQNIKGTGGAVYVRWGHDKCPSQSALVYSGYVGGASHTYSGGAADYICLPPNPTKSSDKRTYMAGSFLWGAEYQLGSRSVHPEHDHDVPCAVCQSKHRANSLMLPGRDICPQGWSREYNGILMSGYYTHKAASQHVCVDNARKTVPGGVDNKDGKLLYAVRTYCPGSLKCPPYENNQLVTCAVCTN